MYSDIMILDVNNYDENVISMINDIDSSDIHKTNKLNVLEKLASDFVNVTTLKIENFKKHNF